MRLIDADKIVYFCGTTKSKHDPVTREKIEKMLTVKAITIEWINSYTTGLIFSDDYEDNADSIDYYISCIKEMVRDWEKENETN